MAGFPLPVGDGRGGLLGWDPPCCCWWDAWCLNSGKNLQPAGAFWACLLVVEDPLASVSRWGSVASVLVGRKVLPLQLLIVCKASDQSDLPFLAFTLVLSVGLTFDLEE